MKLNKKTLKIVFFPLFFIAMIVLIIVFFQELKTVFGSTEAVSEWVNKQGAASWLLFIGIQIFQVVIFIVPGEVTQIAGGYLFGIGFGFLLSVTGILIGSILNFYIARISGGAFVEKIIGHHKYDKFQKVLSEDKQVFLFFMLFLIPGIPKDIVCYFAGLSRISIGKFILFSTIGRIPGIIGSVIIGSAIVKGNITVVIIVASVSVFIFILGLFLRKKFIKVKL